MNLCWTLRWFTVPLRHIHTVHISCMKFQIRTDFFMKPANPVPAGFGNFKFGASLIDATHLPKLSWLVIWFEEGIDFAYIEFDDYFFISFILARYCAGLLMPLHQRQRSCWVFYHSPDLTSIVGINVAHTDDGYDARQLQKKLKCLSCKLARQADTPPYAVAE